MIELASIEEAAQRLTPVLRATRVEQVDSLSKLAGRDLWLKPEYRQRTGSFKVRGAYNRLSRLRPGTRVVAASAGNHAQGVALAASFAGVHADIYMPATAALPKLDATKAYGATVHTVDGGVHECIDAARDAASARGAVEVPPFDDPLVVAGQGTVGLELAVELPPGVRSVLVPVGGGGLVAGIAVALKSLRPDVEVVGVEAEGAASMQASLAAGEPVALDTVTTIADGIAVRAPSQLTFDHVRRYVDDVVTVSDEDITRAVVVLLERAKAVVEPAGAAGLAAVLAGRPLPDGPACVVLTGGNVDPLLLARLIDHGLTAAGRYLILNVVLPDRPGSLAGFVSAVAALGLNIITVEHHRSGLALPVNTVEVVAHVETRNRDHQHEVLEHLRGEGYAVRSTL